MKQIQYHDGQIEERDLIQAVFPLTSTWLNHYPEERQARLAKSPQATATMEDHILNYSLMSR